MGSLSRGGISAPRFRGGSRGEKGSKKPGKALAPTSRGVKKGACKQKSPIASIPPQLKLNKPFIGSVLPPNAIQYFRKVRAILRKKTNMTIEKWHPSGAKKSKNRPPTTLRLRQLVGNRSSLEVSSIYQPQLIRAVPGTARSLEATERSSKPNIGLRKLSLRYLKTVQLEVCKNFSVSNAKAFNWWQVWVGKINWLE